MIDEVAGRLISEVTKTCELRFPSLTKECLCNCHITDSGNTDCGICVVGVDDVNYPQCQGTGWIPDITLESVLAAANTLDELHLHWFGDSLIGAAIHDARQGMPDLDDPPYSTAISYLVRMEPKARVYAMLEALAKAINLGNRVGDPIVSEHRA